MKVFWRMFCVLASAGVAGSSVAQGNERVSITPAGGLYGLTPGTIRPAGDIHYVHDFDRRHVSAIDFTDPPNARALSRFAAVGAPLIEYVTPTVYAYIDIVGPAPHKVGIVDYSDPRSPVATAVALGLMEPTHLMGLRSRLLVATSGSVNLIDISDPRNPVLDVAPVNMGQSAFGQGHAAISDRYLATSLGIYDFADPNNPALITGPLSTHPQVTRMEVVGDLLFVFSRQQSPYSDAIDVHDVRNPAAPIQAHVIPNAFAYTLATDAERKLVIMDGKAFSIGDDARLTELITYQQTPGNLYVPWGMANGYAFESTLSVLGVQMAYDMTDVANPRPAGSPPTFAIPQLIGSDDTRLFMLFNADTPTSNYVEIDITDPFRPSVALMSDFHQSNGLTRLRSVGQYAFGISQDATGSFVRLNVIDFRSPTEPQLISGPELSAPYWHAPYQQLILTLEGLPSNATLRLWDYLSDGEPIPPVEKASLNFVLDDDESYFQQLFIAGATAVVVASGKAALIDLSDISNPMRVGTLESPGLEYLTGDEGILVQGHYDEIEGALLRLYDISAPANPTIAATLPGGYFSMSGRKLAVSFPAQDNHAQTRVYDLTDPANPVLEVERPTHSFQHLVGSALLSDIGSGLALSVISRGAGSVPAVQLIRGLLGISGASTLIDVNADSAIDVADPIQLLIP